MSYEGELQSHYAGVRHRLYHPAPRVIPAPPKVIAKKPEPRARNIRRPKALAKPLTARSIVAEVSRKHHVSAKAIMSDSRMAIYIPARREAVMRMYVELGHSLMRIGRLFKRDHTTILHMIRELAKADPAWGARYQALRDQRRADRDLLIGKVMQRHLSGMRACDIARDLDVDRSSVCNMIRTGATRLLLNSVEVEEAQGS